MHRTARAALLAGLAIAVAHLGDRWAWHHLVSTGIYDKDIGRMFRTVGYYPIWVLAGLALGLQARSTRAGLQLGLFPGIAGLMDEVLKILFRRERPGLHDGAYYFRPFSDHFWSTRDIGLPSSHSMVAFAGAWVLCRLYPRAAPVWLFLAAGCAVTRVLAQAHFLSDVTVGAIAGIVVAELLVRRFGKREARSVKREA